MNTINKIKLDYKDIDDFKIKTYKLHNNNKLYIIFIQSLTNQNKINDFISKNIILFKNITNNKIKNINDLISGSNIKEIKFNEYKDYLNNGFTLVIYKNKYYAVETKANLSRSITEAQIEKTIKGPKDSFVENIEINTGLIKRRLKTNKLKSKTLYLGTYSKTKITINYLENKASIKDVKSTYNKLKKLKISKVIDSSIIVNYLSKNNKTIFPTIKQTERPDIAVNSLSEGKIVILVDTSQFAIITPSFFIDFINPISDLYTKSINITFLKLLRLFCFFISIFTPAIYLALINYNIEAIPTSLLTSLINQRLQIPFPAFFEAIIMLIIVEILRECDIRFPSNFGSSISILGALILGDAAVSAGIVSPILIIIISITFISSLIFTELELTNAIRNYRFLALFLSSILGLYGCILSIIFLLSNMIDIKTNNYNYLFPIEPFNKKRFNKTVIKTDYNYKEDL